MAGSGLHYFAYGSNLLFARLHARTPSIRNRGVAVLGDHRLHFNKPGGDGSGKCGIEAGRLGEQVLGVVYSIDAAEKPLLDEIEGVGHGYSEQWIEVDMGGEFLDVFTYYPTRHDCALPPFDWYKNFVLQGALENASHATPVPGGVGPMTIALLMANTLTSACRSAGRDVPKF